MIKPFALVGLGLLAAAIAGCTTMPGLQLASGSASLRVQPQILEGSYRAQALVAPWTPQDVAHVEIRVLTLSGAGDESPTLVAGKPLVQELLRADLASPFTLSGLSPNTRYRVRARAFKTAGTEAADVISTDAAFADVAVMADDRPLVATLSIPLKDVPFDGEATSSVEILAGRLAPVGTESLQLGASPE